jgi:S-adenosylmethionine hydrolase
VPGPLITLTTDFGAGSAYVAQVKGVLLSALPTARLVDVTHELPAHDIAAAEVCLRGTAFSFPLGTTHLVVVDPGVGTARRALAVQARGMTFVGPDNGVLGVALAQPGARVVNLDRPELFRHPVASTFHGRDLFAPVAAELAAGLDLDQVGQSITDAQPSTLPPARFDVDSASGEVLAADRFGNLTTNLGVGELERCFGDWQASVDGRPLRRCATYGDADRGDLVVLAGSDGYLEVAVREGSAAEHLGRVRGVPVQCRGSGA